MYTAQTWINGSGGNTPTSAERFNYMEAGIASAGTMYNVRDYGAVGDGTTDDAPAIQAALTAAGAASGGIVFVPAGSYAIGTELKVPSRIRFCGAGMARTVLTMKAGVDGNLNVITNASNNKVARTNYDEFIEIADMTVDGNRPGRAVPAVPSIMDGSCINLSTTRRAIIERVFVRRGYRHGVDISASEYPEGGGVTATAQGPSYGIVVRNCLAEGPFGDDAFTTHFSWGLVIEDCRAFTASIDFSGSQGIEIDDGSRDVVVRNCYVTGFVKGYQAKGHVDTNPARQVVFENCVADGCGYGFDISHYNPTSYPATTYRVAADVVLRSCRSINNVTRHTDYFELRALRITGYDNVRVYDFVSLNNPGGNVLVGVGASNVQIEGIVFENVATAMPVAGEGLLQFRDDTGVGCDVRRIDVRASTPTSVPQLTMLGTSSVPPITWETPALASGFGGSAFLTRQGNECQLQLRDVVPSSATTLQVLAAVLPVGRRPARQTDFVGVTATGVTVRFWLASDGTLRGLFPSTAAVSATVSYFVGN